MRTALFLATGLVVLLAVWLLGRAVVERAARRAVRRFRPRLDRYKLTRKRTIVAALLRDQEIATAVREHAAEHGVSEAAAWGRVRTYLDEIIPFFSILAYYKFGYLLSRALLTLFYKVTVDYEREDPFRGLPRDSVVIYLMNHRSNADYVLVAYALLGDVSLSYAVGEWARAFPLEYLFKSFGSYFIRRKYREPLYHTVLARYVQHITRHGVTQGIFPEGGLTRDGTLRPAKIGLLDYALGVASDPAYRARMYVVPVGINYDRVLEDRTLLSELASRVDGHRTPRLRQVGEVARYVVFNLGRLVGRRWKRYGRAAVTIGVPVPVSSWLDRLEGQGIHPFDLERPERLGHVQAFCDEMMGRIGGLIPVTPVALACAALQSLDGDFVRQDRLLERMGELREVLRELNARVLKAESSTEEVFDRAYRMLRMRRVIAREGEGYVVLSRGRPLISYYANSVAHLLGPFAASVRARDALPSTVAMGGWGGLSGPETVT
ncbi:MAG: 1-acyl-sn-glycerol-3-phosphate acyltransferase [Gemmatimonadaceae bacterium]|nr:1-acyl-sn-glycerol-3-phosphate acyltransferase [Gemmatimonadaceae bacterium]